VNEKRKAVAKKLLDEIHLGKITENGKLPSERDLSILLGEHRTIVREALICLEALDVIEIRGRSGIYVSKAIEDEVKKQFLKSGQWPADIISKAMELRQLIDPAAAAISAIRRGEGDIAKLKSCLDNMKALVEDQSDESGKACAYWDNVFHAVIASSTGNSYLTRVYEGIMESVENAVYLSWVGNRLYDRRVRAGTFGEHFRMFEAIRAQNHEDAERFAEEHLSRTLNTIIGIGIITPSSNLFNQKIAGRLRFEK
jgi:GntR family transcriptional repressor for pyruvate dehydrogenase complex